MRKRLDVEAEIERTSAPDVARVTVATEILDRGSQKRRVLAIALIGMAVVTAGIFAVNVWRSSRARTTQLVTLPVPIEERTLTYWITVQKFRNERPFQDPFTLAGEINFEADYQIRVNIRSPQAGYLYILNEGPPEGTAQPEFVVLFPSPTANKGSPLITADQVVQIPEQFWIKFDEQRGTEKLWLVFSSDTVPEFEAVKEFVNPRTRGLITDRTRSQAVQNFFTTHSTQKATAEKSDTQTTLKSIGKLLIYPVKLEHH